MASIEQVNALGNVPTAPLGKNGPRVPRLGFGLMGLSAYYGAVKPDAERMAVLDKAWEIGERFWDSADVYGDNEELIGRWFAANPDKRKSIYLATKFANTVRPPTQEEIDNGEANDTKSILKRRIIDSSPAHAKAACEKSLARLGIDCIDLYYVHRVDGKTPIEETMRALVELKDAGKIRAIGLSEVSATTVRRAHSVHPVTAVQIEYSPWELSIESDQTNLLKTCRELGVAVVAYSPIGRGMLTGTIRSTKDLEADDVRSILPRFQGENFQKNLVLVDKIGAVADKKGVSVSQIVLAWLMAQGEDIFPIPGTTKIERLVENFESLNVVLSEVEERELRETISASAVFGLRYPSHALHTLYGETPPLEA